MKKDFYKTHFEQFVELIKFNQKLTKNLNSAVSLLSNLNKKNKVLIFGNGGSAAIASHIAVDLTKNAKIKTTALTDASLITCFSNDFQHENWMKKATESYYDRGDIVIIISSSGKSKNIVNAANYCKKNKIKMITLSGMNNNNNLNLINKNGVNFWIDSYLYNHIELAHLYLLLLIVDKILSKKSNIKKKKL